MVSSKIAIIGILTAVLTAVFCWIARDYYQLIQERGTWEAKYKQVEQAQRESEAESSRLREKRDQLDKDMAEWRLVLRDIQQQTTNTQRQVRNLAHANKELRDILLLPMGRDLHRVLWPQSSSGHANSDQNGNRIISPGMDTGNR